MYKSIQVSKEANIISKRMNDQHQRTLKLSLEIRYLLTWLFPTQSIDKERRVSYASVSPWFTRQLVGLKSTKMMINSITVNNTAEQKWYSGYSWTIQLNYDRGSELIGKEFQSTIKHNYGTEGKPMTARNFHSNENTIFERIHQTIEKCI
jgi:hypothetical protein